MAKFLKIREQILDRRGMPPVLCKKRVEAIEYKRFDAMLLLQESERVKQAGELELENLRARSRWARRRESGGRGEIDEGGRKIETQEAWA